MPSQSISYMPTLGGFRPMQIVHYNRYLQNLLRFHERVFLSVRKPVWNPCFHYAEGQKSYRADYAENEACYAGFIFVFPYYADSIFHETWLRRLPNFKKLTKQEPQGAPLDVNFSFHNSHNIHLGMILHRTYIGILYFYQFFADIFYSLFELAKPGLLLFLTKTTPRTFSGPFRTFLGLLKIYFKKITV